MLFCKLTISSKNRQSLSHLTQICLKNKNLNFKIITKYFKDKTSKKIVTILKSPHINKTAQEQFEERNFTRHIQIRTTKAYSFLIFLKRITNNLLTDVKIKVNFNIKSNFYSYFKNNKTFNPDNFKIYFYRRKIKNTTFLSKKKNYIDYYNFFCKTKLKNYFSKNTANVLKSLEIYGINHQKISQEACLGSSVVEQRTENPWVDSSILPLNTYIK